MDKDEKYSGATWWIVLMLYIAIFQPTFDDETAAKINKILKESSEKAKEKENRPD